VTSSTRLIDDVDRQPLAVVRRRVTAVGPTSADRQSTSRWSAAPLSTSPSPTVKTTTETQNDEQCCCCCCCTCDVSRAPPVCHCQCPATKQFYFRSAFFSDDENDEEPDNDDNESGCSCCQCDVDVIQASNTPSQTGNELLAVSTTKLSSVAPLSLSGEGLNDVNGRLPSWSTTKHAWTPTTVTSSSSTTGRLANGGMASFFAFLRSRGRLWLSGRSGSAASDVVWKRRQGRAVSTLPPCTCGLGDHFDPPLTVAQQVDNSRFRYSQSLALPKRKPQETQFTQQTQVPANRNARSKQWQP